METFKVNSVEVILDGSDSIYQCGHTISGSVNINLNGELNVSLVSIQLKSEAEVEFEDYITRAGVAFVNDIEKYLDIEYKIPDNIRDTTIKTGSLIIPFTFKLPNQGIPTSFQGSNGFIKYWIEVVINNDTESLSSGKTVAFRGAKYLSVESPIMNNLHLSVGGGIEKSFGFLFIGSGKVTIEANIRKKGHIIGEKLGLQCRVTNESTVDVTPRISLSQIVIYMAEKRHLTFENRFEPVIGKQVNAGQTEVQMISIVIPSDISLSIKSRLISIKYYIHVTLDIPRERDIHLNLPIIITNKFAFDNYHSIM